MICHSGLFAVCPLLRGVRGQWTIHCSPNDLGRMVTGHIGQGFSFTFSCQSFSRFCHSILVSSHISSNNRRTYHIIISSNYNPLPSRLPLTKPT
ncbi:hypothetical protein HOY82DRAFT_484662 [Tuber indicum]|nr:hypothetical protein HOY82DRAFT_484662 [Tuber indicum]